MSSPRLKLPLHVREIKFTHLDSGYDIESAEGMEICRMAENCDSPGTNRKDAEAIVRAVNHHDALVAHLRGLAAVVESEFPDEDDRYLQAQRALELLKQIES
jgi:hypothetical protein